jgi:hypothetical protein
MLSGSRCGDWNTDGCQTGICNMHYLQERVHIAELSGTLVEQKQICDSKFTIFLLGNMWQV